MLRFAAVILFAVSVTAPALGMSMDEFKKGSSESCESLLTVNLISPSSLNVLSSAASVDVDETTVIIIFEAVNLYGVKIKDSITCRFTHEGTNNGIPIIDAKNISVRFYTIDISKPIKPSEETFFLFR